MPRQNRVLPDGDIIAIPERGTMMGNRGILHDPAGHLGRERWRHKAWLCCLLDFKGRRRPVMDPHHYTALFFLDEAVALAAGHRPCAECRRSDHALFRAAWARAFGVVTTAPQMDAALHESRITPAGSQRRHVAPAKDLPDGVFVLRDGAPMLVCGRHLYPFRPAGYGAPLVRPAGPLTVLTPAVTVAVLRAGYRTGLHPSARTAG